ncbi:superoxide dismutase, partial [candidate division GN15 bacterium]|nr:superoxide dismutase [candidate division GN15 bacterium]
SFPYKLPSLPYDYDALEVAIDAETMKLHHTKHHQAYTDKFNAALEKHSDLQGKHITELLADPNSLPEDVRGAIRNHGGGYFNHALFWPLMTGSGSGEPSGDLADAIKRDFGSLDDFKKQFSNAAATLFGSGWAWLAADNDGKLSVIQTANQDTPLLTGHKPVVGLDVWEHAFYLRYQNRKPEYIEAFFKVINWDQATKNFKA